MKNVTVQYRQMKSDGLPDGFELKGKTVDVLRECGWADHAKDRVLSLDQDGSVVILNKISPIETWNGPIFAGQLIHLRNGADVHAVTQSLEDDASEFILQHLDVGQQTRVLKGALYFASNGNHVGLIEAQELRGLMLERYLTALFQKANALDFSQSITLMSKFMSGEGKALSKASEVVVNAAASTNQEAGSRVVESEVASEREHEQATVFDILRLLGWDEAAIESLGNDIPPDGWVEGFFRIFIKSRRKRGSISRNTINEVLRNIDPAVLALKGDGRERNGIVNLSRPCAVKTVGPGGLNRSRKRYGANHKRS